jgi:hypothetical protein
LTRRAEFKVGPGAVLSRLGRAEVEPLVEAWLKVFGRQSAPGMSKYMWHVFSAATYPSLALQAALDAYATCESSEYVVLSNERDQAVITDQKPTSCSLSDYYVFPINLAWTIAVTHEDGWLGPYFAKHPEFAKLNEENLKKIRKAQESAEAKRKGYW